MSAAVSETTGDELRRRLSERGREYFPELGRAHIVRVTGKPRRAYSQVYRVTLANDSGLRRRLAVKICPNAETQFAAMDKLWPQFALHPTCKIPRPLDCFPDQQALVMELVEGAPLPSRLPWIAWSGAALSRAEADCRRVGQWLRFFHGLAAASDPAPVDLDAKWRGIEESLQELREAGVPPQLSRWLTDRLGVLAERVSRRPRVVSHLHGDFKADNVLVDRQTVTVLDLGPGITRAAVDHDLASFLTSLFLLPLTRPLSWSALERLRRAFLDGYFGQPSRDESAIVFLHGVGLVDASLEILSRRRSVVARAWITRVLARTISALTCASERISR